MDDDLMAQAQDKMAMAESVRRQLVAETDPVEIERLEEDYALLFDEGREAVHAAMREGR
jgi:hypothetical protein